MLHHQQGEPEEEARQPGRGGSGWENLLTCGVTVGSGQEQMEGLYDPAQSGKKISGDIWKTFWVNINRT